MLAVGWARRLPELDMTMPPMPRGLPDPTVGRLRSSLVWRAPAASAAWLRRSVLALPMAAVALLSVVVINELSHQRSAQALAKLEQRGHASARIEAVLRRLLDAETAQRGYLLTHRPVYLAALSTGCARCHRGTALAA